MDKRTGSVGQTVPDGDLDYRAGALSSVTGDQYTAPRLDSSALITIDMQVDFLGADLRSTGDVADVLSNVDRLLTAYRQAGLPIIHIVRLYAGDDVDLVRRGLIESGTSIVRPGSSGAGIVPLLYPSGAGPLDSEQLMAGKLQAVGPMEWVMWKPRWGGFYRTPLDSKLHELDVSTVVISGCNFPNCPRATAYEASERDYRVLLVSDGITGLRPDHLNETQKMGIGHDTANEIAENVSAMAPNVTIDGSRSR